MLVSKITVYKYNKPAKNIRISLEFTGFTNMGFTRTFYTNNNGIAFVEHASSGKAKVYIDGKRIGTITAPGSDVYYL